MDVLTGLLDGPRARGAFVLKTVFNAPWAVSIEDQAPLSIVVMARGSAVFTGSTGPIGVEAGDVIITRGPAPYVFGDSASTRSTIRILPGQICLDPHDELLDRSMSLGVRTWGNAVDGETMMLIGTYTRATSVGTRVLARLPHDIVLHHVHSPLVDLLEDEIVRNEPGQEAVLDRLLDLLLVTCLREVLDDAPHDPIVSHARRLMEHHPEHPWTVASLAAACGISRAALGRRFTATVGEPPLAYLTGWRLALAADLLTSDATVASVATRVGYSNAFALSAAFKRAYGVAPTHYRRAQLSSA